MNMIGHESVRPHLDSGLTGLLSQQVSINLLVAVLKKDRLPTIPTLRNVMRKARETPIWQKLSYFAARKGDRVAGRRRESALWALFRIRVQFSSPFSGLDLCEMRAS